LEELLEREPGLEALTLMEHLCRQYPVSSRWGSYAHCAAGEALAGGGGTRARSFLPQEHPPGRQAQSDFTHIEELEVTIAGSRLIISSITLR